MEIIPNTTIKVLKNVPLRSDYKDTIYFESPTAQSNYFSSCTKFTFQKNTYQRVNKGKIRINKIADDLYDCNYVMFQNSSYGHKWFYGFIESVEYVNNAVSEITYKLDCVQTWFFDMKINQCFVEREHSVTDNVGENLLDEHLEYGDLITKYFTFTIPKSGQLGGLYTIVASTFGSDGKFTSGCMINKVYNGLNFYAFDTREEKGVNELNEWLKSVNSAGKIDGIVSIFMMDANFYDKTGLFSPIQMALDKSNFVKLDGDYIPRNKKLYNYPYNFLRVTNQNGSDEDFKFENFDDTKNSNEGSIVFNYFGDLSPNPTTIVYPLSRYEGVAMDVSKNVTINNFPQCAFTNDAYVAWLSQNAGSLSSQLLSSVAGIGMTIATDGLTAATGIKGIEGIASLIGQYTDEARRPPKARGNVSGGLMACLGTYAFEFKQMTIKKEYLKIIDDYFDMFGYACHRVKTPNISSRPHWNYVKTNGCVITGSVPCDDLITIQNAFDSGIRFWKHGSEVGNFNLNNSPT